MRKLFFIFLLILFPFDLRAQFPATIIASWDPNPIADNVTKYTIDFNEITTDIPMSNCNSIECSATLVVPNTGTYTISLRAHNSWGASEAATLTFNASSPGRSGNLRIRIQ